MGLGKAHAFCNRRGWILPRFYGLGARKFEIRMVALPQSTKLLRRCGPVRGGGEGLAIRKSWSKAHCFNSSLFICDVKGYVT